MAIWMGLLAVMFGLPGCWNPFSPGDGGDGPGTNFNRESPDNLLAFFADAYQNKNIDKYMEALDDSYTFTFRPEDWDSAGVTAEKPYWGKTEDVPRTVNMFNSPKTLGISMDWLTPVSDWEGPCPDSIWIPPVPPDQDGYWQQVEGLCCTRKPDIKVTIEGKDGGEPITKWVHTSWIWLTAIQDRNNPKLWTILRIIERDAPVQ